MEFKQPKINTSTVQRATDLARHYADKTVTAALGYLKDPDSAIRVGVKVECKYCYYVYTSRVGGCAMTTLPCELCGEDQLYNSTNTDKLCKNCAVKNELCKYCGADIALRPRRKLDLTEEKA